MMREDRINDDGAETSADGDDPQPDEHSSEHDEDRTAKLQTERSEEREREDDEFIPVIVKRTDEVRRHPDDVLQAAIDEGAEQLERPTLSLWLSSILAGLIVGISVMAVAIMTMATSELTAEMGQRLLTALMYPLGFVLCLMSGSELFTEHTATAVYPVLDRRASVVRLFRLWIIVATGNLIGVLLCAVLLTQANDVVLAGGGYVTVAEHVVAARGVPLLTSAVIAGWLMALGAWLIVATPPTLSQLVCVYIVTFLIGVGDLHHSIVGAGELFAGMLMGASVSIEAGLRFVALALVGNLVGGSVFVAILNYGHIRQTRAVASSD